MRSDRKNFENKFLLEQSRAAHERDVKNNAAPRPFRRRRDEPQHPKSAAFERRLNGG